MTAATDPGSRIVTLDVVRGVAVMGIFSVNVVGMAMFLSAYFYPPIFGFESVWDHIMWTANFLLIDGKMRSLFSMLFGASTLLVIERAVAAGRSPAKTHFARMLVLLLFGLIHFYFIWWGDILSHYAMIGMVAFLAWRLSAPWLLLLSAVLFAYYYTPGIASVPQRIAAYEAAHSPTATEQARQDWERSVEWFRPTPADLAEDRTDHASPVSHVRMMVRDDPFMPFNELFDFGPETLALMLLGMAGFRSGFLTGQWSDRAYRWVAAVGLGIGLAGFAGLAVWVVRSDFRMPETLAAVFPLSGPFRPIMAVGYAALIILLFRRSSAIRGRFAAVGRAAFTNYLGTSLIGMFVFFDFGLGLYGEVTRAEAWLLVPLVWLLMLAWSKPWLDRFAYGPFEWLWRSLARWEIQPMRKRLPAGALAGEA